MSAVKSRAQDTINIMVDQLNAFASEVDARWRAKWEPKGNWAVRLW